MSETKRAIGEFAAKHGDEGYLAAGAPPRGWTPRKEKEMSEFTVEVVHGDRLLVGKTNTPVTLILTKKEALSLSFQLEAMVQDMEMQEAGMCSKCKGSCVNMDGTECTECGGRGFTKEG